jgi:hypothetical protein
MSVIRRLRPRPGTVLASIALFVALGGGAYAVSGPPGPNTIGKSEIVTGGVGKAEVGSKAVGRSEIRTDSVGGGKLCEQGDRGCSPFTGAHFDESKLTGVKNAGTVFQRFRDAEFGLPAGSGVERIVLSLDVPAGSYLVHGGLTVENEAAAATEGECFLRAGTDFDRATEDLQAVEGDARLDMQLVHTFAAAGTINMACEGGAVAGNIDVRDRKIQAYEVGKVTNTEAPGP